MAIALSLTFIVLLAIIIRQLRKPKHELPLPPSPKKYPLIGHILDIPKEYEWRKYHEWSKQLGSDIISLDMLGSTVIVLDSVQAAEDLLQKRSAYYSSRPNIVMLTELMKCDWLLTVLPYDDRWKLRRKMLQSEFNHTETMRYQPHESRYARDLLRRLLETPDEFMEHVKYITGAKILSVSYGIDAKPSNDPNISLVSTAVDLINKAAIPGEYLVEFLPWLKYLPEWVPGAGFKRVARMWRGITDEMVRRPYEVAKEVVIQGDAVPSFMSYCLEKMDWTKDIEAQERVIKETTATLYAGGADTTVSSLYTFFLAMLLYPSVQKKAQQELDEVLSRSRLPDFGDEGVLPYIGAIVLEVLRWQPVTPLGVPHLVTKDDEYEGYRIPAGSIVFANQWAMLHNETTFPDPERFDPDRWLKDGKVFVEGGREGKEGKAPVAVFGFGRRICPGRHLAMSSIWIAAATILSVFNISKPVDANGTEVDPPLEYTSALICHPKDFKCVIQPRFAEAEELIRASVNNE